MQRHFLTINPGALSDTGTSLSLAWKVPSGFGGVTVTSASFVADSTGTLGMYLVNYGSTGTVIGGTIAGIGTATVWATDTPQALTITAANAYVDEGEYVMLKKVESAASNDTGANCAMTVEMVDGVVTVG